MKPLFRIVYTFGLAHLTCGASTTVYTCHVGDESAIARMKRVVKALNAAVARRVKAAQ